MTYVQQGRSGNRKKSNASAVWRQKGGAERSPYGDGAGRGDQCPVVFTMDTTMMMMMTAMATPMMMRICDGCEQPDY